MWALNNYQCAAHRWRRNRTQLLHIYIGSEFEAHAF